MKRKKESVERIGVESAPQGLALCAGVRPPTGMKLLPLWTGLCMALAGSSGWAAGTPSCKTSGQTTSCVFGAADSVEWKRDDTPGKAHKGEDASPGPGYAIVVNGTLAAKSVDHPVISLTIGGGAGGDIHYLDKQKTKTNNPTGGAGGTLNFLNTSHIGNTASSKSGSGPLVELLANGGEGSKYGEGRIGAGGAGGNITVTQRGGMETYASGSGDGAKLAPVLLASADGGSGGSGGGGSGQPTSTGGVGGAIVFANSGNIISHGSSAPAVHLHADGGAGGSKHGTGGQGGRVSVTLESGRIATGQARSHGLIATANGGLGSNDGGNTHRMSGPSGNGGASSVVMAAAAAGQQQAVVQALGDQSIAVVNQAVGGEGAQGAGATPVVGMTGQRGGDGGGGGKATLVVQSAEGSAQVAASGGAGGLLNSAAGGKGGAGGGSTFNLAGQGGDGGKGGNGGSSSIALARGVASFQDGSVAVSSLANGGDGGAGGKSQVALSALSGSGGHGGDGGMASICIGANGDSGCGEFNAAAAPVAVSAAGKGSIAVQAIASGGRGGPGPRGWAFDGQAGGGGYAGQGGTAAVTIGSRQATIKTTGSEATAVLVQSSGGNGGNGGGFSGVIGSGGRGGEGGNGGVATLVNAGALSTTGEASGAAVVQALGGAGGVGGSVKTSSHGLLATVSMAVGGDGGQGGNGGRAVAGNSGSITTAGDSALGLVVQSIGGGGGVGGSAISKSWSYGVDDVLPNLSLSFSAGGSGGKGGRGGSVSASNSGEISTQGDGAMALLAQSVGGQGGTGGDASSRAKAVGSASASLTWTSAIGGRGGQGGDSADVSITQQRGGAISTQGHSANAVLAQSIGGGGGNGGVGNADEASVSLAGSKKDDEGGINVALKFDVAVGGQGGTGGNGGTVTVQTEAGSTIATGSQAAGGKGSRGIVAQSIGGGGGTSQGGRLGVGVQSATFKLAVGGRGAGAGSGGRVAVDNAADIATYGDGSDAIVLQSIGGGGGIGGVTGDKPSSSGLAAEAAGAESGTTEFELDIAIGGVGGKGGAGGQVSATQAGQVATWGAGSTGVLAQSIGGGGGLGGGAVSGTALEFESAPLKRVSSYKASLSLGGRDGSGGDAGAVSVAQAAGAGIATRGDRAMGIVAQSIGGGGGFGVNTLYSGALAPGAATMVLKVGGANNGEAASDGAGVMVGNGGSIHTVGADAWGILAQSIGGGGGVALKSTNTHVSVNDSVGGSNGDGGTVDIALDAGSVIATAGRAAHGVLVQSIGGGGGISARPEPGGVIGFASTPVASGNGDGGNVTIVNRGQIHTEGENAFGILAQSLGGGGGIRSSGTGVVAGANHGSGKGGAISITQNGSVMASGRNAVGIAAQSASGAGAVASPITIDIGGYVSGGQTGSQASGVTIAGGRDNRLTVQAGGTLSMPEGTAVLTDKAAQTVVRNLGTLVGDIIGASQVDNQGTMVVFDQVDLAPAASPLRSRAAGGLGTLTNNGTLELGLSHQRRAVEIGGNYVQGDAAVLKIDLSHVDGHADVLHVRGSAALGSQAEVYALNLLPGRTHTVLTADAGISGKLKARSPLLFDYQLRHTANAVSLSVADRFDEVAEGTDEGYQSVHGYYTRLWKQASPEFATLFGDLSRIYTYDAYYDALDQLSGAEVYAQALRVLPGLHAFAEPLLGDCRQSAQGGTWRTAGGCGWLSLRQSSRSETPDTLQNGFDTDEFQVQAGLQHRLDARWTLSGAFTQLSSRARADGSGTRGSGDYSTLGFALKRSIGHGSFGAAAHYTFGSNRSSRRVGWLDDALQGKQRMEAWGLTLNGAYRLDAAEFYLEPSLAANLTRLQLDGYDETGGPSYARLSVEKQSATRYSLTPRIEIGRRPDPGSTLQWRPYLALSHTRYFGGDWSTRAHIAGASGNAFTVGSGLAQSITSAQAGVSLWKGKDAAWRLDLDYRHDFGPGFRAHAVVGSAQYRW